MQKKIYLSNKERQGDQYHSLKSIWRQWQLDETTATTTQETTIKESRLVITGIDLVDPTYALLLPREGMSSPYYLPFELNALTTDNADVRFKSPAAVTKDIPASCFMIKMSRGGWNAYCPLESMEWINIIVTSNRIKWQCTESLSWSGSEAHSNL
ncbi:hypothetical protein BC941DRAFT_473178 [Chlamydoabsidia padenii]|nr:hypothetical protein BC941DRAFT_473178 [Chlamydoabsidia padenii]